MALNRKQKKQVEVARKKIASLHQLLVCARQQPDDPAEVPRLEAEIAKQEEQIREINKSK